MEIENENKCTLSFERDTDTILVHCNRDSQWIAGEDGDEVWTDEVEEIFEIDMDQAIRLRELLNQIIK